MQKMKSAACIAGVAMIGISQGALATNGDQLFGVTAIQRSMAGAVVAAPPDSATVMTNPAGLAELGMKEVRFDLAFGVLNPTRKVNSSESDSNYYLIPAVRWVSTSTTAYTSAWEWADCPGWEWISPMSHLLPATRHL